MKRDDIGIWTQFCPACWLWTRREFPSPLLLKQVCCSTCGMRRCVTSPPLKSFCTSMPKIAGVLILDIFGLYCGYMVVNNGISLQLDGGGAKGSNCAASTARIQSSWDSGQHTTILNSDRHCCMSFRETLRTQERARVSCCWAVRVLNERLHLSARAHSAVQLLIQCCMQDRYSIPGL